MNRIILLVACFALISCSGMSTRGKVQTAHVIIGASIDIAYTNAVAICEVQEIKPSECTELDAIYTDVKKLHESIGQSVETVMDLTEKIKELE